MQRLRVTHIITGLNVGGAERMLVKLLAALRERFEFDVVSLTDGGSLVPVIEQLDVPVRSMRMAKNVSAIAAAAGLVRHLRRRRPQVVQTWMYHADLIGGLAARLAGVPRLVWNIRASNLDAERSATRIVQRYVNAPLSRWLPNLIVCCGEVARDTHLALGYSHSKLRVIPNGFDLTTFRVDEAARSALRKSLGFPEHGLVIGSVGRLHPMKDYSTFFAAAEILRRRFPAYFLLAGAGMVAENPQVREWLTARGLTDCVRLLGPRADLPTVYNALDLFMLSSRSGEGFPNVLGEAMACGVPCVATDVGDARLIIGETGKVVPPGDPEALSVAAAEILSMTDSSRTELGARARARIECSFSISKIARQYQSLYEELAQ